MKYLRSHSPRQDGVTIPPPNTQWSLHCALRVSGFTHSTVVRQTGPRGKYIHPLEFRYLGLENSYSLGSDAGESWAFQSGGAPCRPLLVASYV